MTKCEPIALRFDIGLHSYTVVNAVHKIASYSECYSNLSLVVTSSGLPSGKLVMSKENLSSWSGSRIEFGSEAARQLPIRCKVSKLVSTPTTLLREYMVVFFPDFSLLCHNTDSSWIRYLNLRGRVAMYRLEESGTRFAAAPCPTRTICPPLYIHNADVGVQQQVQCHFADRLACYFSVFRVARV